MRERTSGGTMSIIGFKEKMKIRVIDLFAGPGGLGEGFASYGGGDVFSIAASAEMEASAHSTLTLRAFYRLAKRDERALKAYYDYCNYDGAPHPSQVCKSVWQVAQDEALQLELGKEADNAFLDAALERQQLNEDRTILIGGPPCQAYSLVGRARNRGLKDYVPEHDHRHYLYQQYLRIVHRYRPAIFVMENVKGILTSSVGGKRVFHEILKDLADPGRAVGQGSGVKYRIHSLVDPVYFDSGHDPAEFNSQKFVIRSEQHGIPQARHRVILFGVREDIPLERTGMLQFGMPLVIEDAIRDLPKLRSRLSKADNAADWRNSVLFQASGLIGSANVSEDQTVRRAREVMIGARSGLIDTESFGALRLPRMEAQEIVTKSGYRSWIEDSRLEVVLNHESRGHMESDLGRYFYAAAYAQGNEHSPKGHEEFSLPGLAPMHANWETGKFKDRFRVQIRGKPSTTITSHIAKDGHYFIHYDPTQCRSLTVREAARLQSFPDNYFFQGTRTQQYHQVGNAVPSYLANQIAHVVSQTLS
ncbi:DNA cytosine methyltransferase [Brachymonas denitrificans]|uniref:DNA (cytosine-5-)-methyltransferase n=1 Tax=Brachymonas denitrificans DSM 15123 TaxID=1121117 RepID=A0A1H8DTH9_9BURK|nr:DNA (cytosine-5-)-methyltransferase [Brachymonas denitrificans]SEN09848.1 DNA (cytosine-5)-methyltransferase 1 [Brachymonas denitrificans DSM 15123]